MNIIYQDKEQIKQSLQSGQYVVACVHRNGSVAYVGAKNAPGYGSHEPLLKSVGALDNIDNYWRYTFNAEQGTSILFVIPKYCGKQIVPSTRATNEVHEAFYNSTRFWESLSSQLSQELDLNVSSSYDLQDPDGLLL